MTIRRLALHLGAVVLLATDLVLRVVFDGALWAVLVGYALMLLAVAWFTAPLVARIERFRARGEATRRRINA